MKTANLTPAIAAAQAATQAIQFINSVQAQAARFTAALKDGLSVRPQGDPRAEAVPVSAEDYIAALGDENAALLRGLAAAIASAKPVTK